MKFALLVLYAAGTLSAPVLDERQRYPKSDIKIVECSGSRFRPGATFEYEYAGETVHKVEGTTEDSTGLQLSARVLISQLEGCVFHMKLTSVGLRTKSMDQQTFTDSAESKAYEEALTKHDLLFNMKGNAVTSVRPHPDETTEMLNIKRGILSTLNLDESATTESDIHGTCATKIVEEGGLIVKYKSLSECSDRTQEEIGIQSSSIKTTSSLKPLDSKSTCTYSVERGSIRKVVCEESHLFRPFSGRKENSGAITLVKQQMKLKEKLPVANLYINLASYTTTKPVIFDHASSISKAETLPPAIGVVMQRLVDSNHLSVKQTSANEFTSLVRMFRKLDKRSMSAIWDDYFDCTSSKVCAKGDSNMKDLYRQYMLDAIAYCGTPTCVSVVKDVTIDGEIDGERANMFLQSIALVAKTTNAMIRDILEIAQKKPSRQVFLTLGTLISRHCSKSPEECDSKSASAVVAAENFLETTLGDCSGQDNHERVEEILLTLKAIGNAKRPVSAQSSIIRCAMKSQHNNITISSFQALRGMPCGDALGELQEVITNENLDADKRIYAFQAAMKCTSRLNLEYLVHHYNIETNTQLASYMWTYFTNLMESTNPEDKKAKTILHEIATETPLKKTDLPMYQYSKHFEKSLYIDSLQTGATAKADLVFHPDGFLPSTAMFDMTAKVMGVPVDLVQTAVGIDGVETLLENVFGPDGVMPTDFAFKMFNWTLTAEKLREMTRGKDAKNRERRAVRRDDMPMVNDIHEAVNKKPAQPSGFMSLRIMGQEVRIMSYDDIYAMIDQIDNMNVIQLLLNVAKGGKKTFSKSVMFLEMTHSVPTGLGLPLKLKLSGSTVGTVDLEGKFDIRNMFWGPGALNINGFVKPSAVVEISGQMSTESNYVSTGLRVTSNMMVSNELKGSILYKQGNTLKINLDTPSKPVQLFKFSSTPFMFVNEKFVTIEGSPRMINQERCLKSQLIGYGMCTSIRMPLAFRNYEAPYFPLTGPAHFGVSLVRGDDKLTTFQFLTTMTKQANGLGGVIEFSTPGAVYERKLSARMFYTDINNEKALTVSTERFGKTGAVKVSYNTISHRTSLEVKHNFLTTKDITTRILFFNQTSLASKQMGIQLTADYDWYKFNHVTKFVSKDSKYILESHTEYAPKKSITAALEFNRLERKVRAIFDVNQVRQAVELIGKLESSKNERGVTFTFVHVPTQKTATFYTGYKIEANKKEIMTKLNVMGKTVKNILGWYKNGDVESIEDIFSFQEKTAKFEASWEDRKGETALQFSADVFGKKALSTAIYSNKGDQKFIDLSSRVLGKEVSTSFVITNRNDERSLVLRLNSAANPTEASVGYYDKNNVITLQVAAKGFDNRVKLFWTLDTANDYKSSFGFGLNKYAGGVRGFYGNNRACASVYYKTPTAEKIAMKTCAEYNNADRDMMQSRQLMASIEFPQCNQKLALDNEFFKEIGHMNLVSRIIYNNKEICTKTLDVVYKGLADSAVSFDIKNKLYRGGVKLYSKKEGRSAETDIGLLFTVMDNTLLFLNKYQPGKVASAIVVNNRPLPVTTEVTYEKTAAAFTPTFSINMGEYSLKTTAVVLYGGKYGMEFTSGIYKQKTTALFGVIAKNFVEITGNKITLVQKAGVILNGEDYVYGWTGSYENTSKDPKRACVITATLHYSISRASTITFTLADSKNKVSMNIDVEYIPNKLVSHFISYNKNKQQLEASVEFLPKMFAKLSMGLEKGEGYMLQSTGSLEWAGFKRAITIINSYVNNEKTFVVSTNFASDISIGLRINKLIPKSVTLFANVFGNNVQLTGVYQNMNIELLLTVNNKIIFQFKGGYNQLAKTFRILAAQQEKVLFDLKSGYNKVMKSFNLALAGVTKWGGVYITQRGERTILNIDVLGKGLTKIILNKKDMSLSIHTLRQPRFSVSFRWVPKSKTFSVQVKTTSSRFTVNLRADWTNKILALNGFLNKERVGMKLFFLKKAMIFKLTLAPQNIMKVTFANTGDKLKMTLQRIIKGKVVNHASFHYAFSTKLSEIVFKWNTELAKKIQDIIRPLIKNAIKDVKEFLTKIRSQDKKLIQLSKDVKAKINEFLKKVDKSIQDFDFVPVKDFITKSSLKFLNQLSELTIEILKTLSTGLENIKAKTPKTVQKLRELIKSGKVMYAKLEGDMKVLYTKLTGDMKVKKEELIAKAKILIAIVEKMIKQGQEMIMEGTKEGKVLIQKGITRGKELIMKGEEMLKVLRADVEQRLVPITKIVQQLTEATKPVVEKFIELAKDFKIRGRRMEDIVKITTVEGRRLLNLYIQKIKTLLTKLEKEVTSRYTDIRTQSVKQFNKYKAQSIELFDKYKAQSIELFDKYKAESIKTLTAVEEYAMMLRVPYTDQNVRQLIERIRVEITRIVRWAKSVKVKRVMADTKTAINNMIKEKSEVFKKQIDELVNRYNKLRVYLPKVSRQVVDKIVAIVRKYMKDVNVLINQASEFAKPLKEYITLVKTSVNKHFGPLVGKITLPDFIKMLKTIKLPEMKAIFEKEIKPLLQQIEPAYKNAIRQVRSLKVGGFRLGPLFDMQMREIKMRLEELLTTMQKEMINLRKTADQLKGKSPDWIVKTSIDASVKILNQIVDYMKNVYKNKDLYIEKATSKVNEAQNILNQQYKRLTRKSFDEVTENILKLSEEGVIVTTGEVSSLIKQIIAMDISGPTWKAMTDIDVVARMERLGVNSKIRKALRYAKRTNVRKFVMNVIATIQKFVNLGIKETSIKAVVMYEKMDKVFKYLRSIPKKDYEAWLRQVATLTKSSRDLVELKIVKIYETSKRHAAVASNFLEQMKKIEVKKYNKMIMKKYNNVKDFITVVSDKSQLVYKDLKQPTIDLFTHYKGIIVPIVEKYYTIIKTILTTEYKKVYAQVESTIFQLRRRLVLNFKDWKTSVTNKIAEIRNTVDKAYAMVVDEYNMFMSKYGHMTWEQVYKKMELTGIKEFKNIVRKIVEYRAQVVKKVKDLKVLVEAKVKQFYQMAVREYKIIVARIEREYKIIFARIEREYRNAKVQVTAKFEEMKAKVMACYKKYEKVLKPYQKLAKVEIERLTKLAKVEIERLTLQAKSLYQGVEAKATQLYNANKDKTLKQIFTEIEAFITAGYLKNKEFITAGYLKHKEIVKAISEKNFDKAKKLISEIQMKVSTRVEDEYKKINLKINTLVIPELKSAYRKLVALTPELQKIIAEVITEVKKEAESIFNQTLRNTIIVSKTIMKAYEPHVTATKKFVNKYSIMYYEILRTQLPVTVAKLEKLVKKTINEMDASVKDCLKSCEKRMNELITEMRVLARTGVAKVAEFVQTTVVRVEKKVREAIETIRRNEKYREYVALVEVKLTQLKKMIEELIKKVKTHPKLIKLRTDIKQKFTEIKAILIEEFERVVSDPKFRELRLKVEVKLNEIKKVVETNVQKGKKFAETKFVEIKRILQDLATDRREFINQKINEFKWFIQVKVQELRMFVNLLDTKFRPTVEQTIELLKQIRKSSKFTADRLQIYATPFVRDAVATTTQYMDVIPKLAEQALIYIKAAPEEAFWNGMKVIREIVKGSIAQGNTVTSKDVEKAVFEFYTEVVDKSEDIYMFVTDQWTKKTVIEVREFVKQIISKITTEYIKLQQRLEALPGSLKAYYVKNLPLLKKLLNNNMAELKALVKMYGGRIYTVSYRFYAIKMAELQNKLDSLKVVVKDTSAFVKEYTRTVMESIKNYWNTLPFKTITDNEIWGEIVAEIKSHELFQLMMKTSKNVEAKVIDLTRKFMEIVVKFIRTKGAILEKELAALMEKSEMKLNQMKTQGRKLYRRSVEQYDVYATDAKAKYNMLAADAKAKYNMLAADAQEKYNMLVAVAKQKYSMMSADAQEKFSKLIADVKQTYNWIIRETIQNSQLLIKTTEKIYAEATISEIVTYIENQYKQRTREFNVLKVKYLKDLEAFVQEYKMIISKLNVKDQLQIVKRRAVKLIEKYMKMTEPYYEDLLKFLNKYETIVKGKYQQLTTEMMARYKKISAQVIAQYKKVSAIVIAKYEKYVAEMKAKYGKDFDKMIAKFNDMIVKFKKVSAEMIEKYEKLSTEVITKYKTLRVTLEQKYKEIAAKVMEMYKKYKTLTQNQLEVIKTKINEKVTTIKKTTIKETVELLKRLPTDLKVFATMNYQQLVQQLNRIKVTVKYFIASYTEKYFAKGEEIYRNLKVRLEAERVRAEELIKTLQMKTEEVVKMLQTYLRVAEKTIYRAQNEIIDTALFVYNYYNLGEKFEKLKKIVIDEIMKIVEQTKKSLPLLEKAARQYVEDYRHKLQMSANKYTSVVQNYARDAEDFTRTTVRSVRKNAFKTRDDMLRGIQQGLDTGKLMLDTVDREMIMNKLREVVDFVKKHIIIIQKEGQVIIKMLHPDIKPILKYYTSVVKTQAQKTYKQLELKGMELLKNVEKELPKLKEKIRKLKNQIQRAVMKSTFDIRRDLNISYKVNKNIVIRLYNVVSRVVSQRYSPQTLRFNILKERLMQVASKGKLLSEAYWKEFLLVLQEAYGDAEKIVLDISKQPSPKAMYEKLVQYITKAVDVLKTKYQPMIAPTLAKLKTEASSRLMEMKLRYAMLRDQYPVKDLPQSFMDFLKSQDITKEKLDATIATMKNSLIATTEEFKKLTTVGYERLRAGVDVKPFALKLEKIWMEFLDILRGIDITGIVCKNDPEVCKLINEGVAIHKVILKKYLAYLSVGKAHVDRAIRKINTRVRNKNGGEKYLATAMIMGNHILTFDNKFYDMVNFVKPKKGAPSPCSYLLARDFQDKKFTLSKLDNAIIIETPDMTVKIRDDGQTKTTIRNVASFGLPVESGSSKCIRMDNLILCHFKDQGMKISVDLKNFFTTISISGWYKGKSQGLLGTLNNEAHDDWRLPNNMITKNINEFANAYELSGRPECRLNLKKDNTKVCDGRTSKMCAKYFEDSESPFAGVEGVASWKPFMEACVRDTKCKKNNRKAHCSIVAAYVALLRTRGVWVPQVNECMMEKGRAVNEEWIQKPTKAIDVVVMVSQHKNMDARKKNVASTMLNLHKLLRSQGKFNVRYSLVGFGGKGVHEAAHTHSLRRGQTIFGYIHDLRSEIKSMPFEGEGEMTNDGYHAILTASRLKFRPAAEKVFIMFNSQPHSAHATGPSFDETKYILTREANAPLFVFDNVNFPKFGKSVGRVIGETERKLYTTNNLKGITSKDLEMPASEFQQLVLLSKGGLFSNTIKNPRQVAASLHDAVTNWVKSDMALCKRCVLRSSWTGQARAICVSDRTARC